MKRFTLYHAVTYPIKDCFLNSFILHRALAYLLVSVCLASTSAIAQNNAARRTMKQQQEMLRRAQEKQKQMVRETASQGGLPTDPELLSLHREFITKAEKLAAEYERKKQLGKAREVYESLVRLMPRYANAEAGLARILKSQTTKESRLAKVLAAKAWQDSGATLQEGMPVYIETQGTWKVVYETGPEGIRIPADQRPRDNQIELGTLIGTIVGSPEDIEKPKPFIVKPGTSFTAEKSGRLYLRMFDIDPSDNEGVMTVKIQSTFN